MSKEKDSRRNSKAKASEAVTQTRMSQAFGQPAEKEPAASVGAGAGSHRNRKPPFRQIQRGLVVRASGTSLNQRASAALVNSTATTAAG